METDGDGTTLGRGIERQHALGKILIRAIPILVRSASYIQAIDNQCDATIWTWAEKPLLREQSLEGDSILRRNGWERGGFGTSRRSPA